MSSSKEDQKFVSKTLADFWWEVATTTRDLCYKELSEVEYERVSREQLKKYSRILLEWKGDKMSTDNKKYSWSYYDDEEGYWFYNIAFNESIPYYGTREQAEQAAQYFLRNNPHRQVKINEHDL